MKHSILVSQIPNISFFFFFSLSLPCRPIIEIISLGEISGLLID
jgi:hypothetical protein